MSFKVDILAEKIQLNAYTTVKRCVRKEGENIFRKWAREQQLGNGQKYNSTEMGKKTIVRNWVKEQQYGNGKKNNSSEMGK